jgi:hypothetical protein
VLKGRIFNASVVSVLLYGCEAWIVSKELEGKVNSFATTCYRMWLGIKPIDRVRLEIIYKMVNQRPLVEIMRQRQLSWVGHALRRTENEIAKIFALYEPGQALGTSKRGRKASSYFSYICNLLFPAKSEVSLAELVKLAEQRHLWKRRVADCCKTVIE